MSNTETDKIAKAEADTSKADKEKLSNKQETVANKSASPDKASKKGATASEDATAQSNSNAKTATNDKFGAAPNGNKNDANLAQSQPHKKQGRSATFVLSLFVAAIAGGCVALLGTVALQKAGVNLALVSPLPAKQQDLSQSQALMDQVDALFKQKSQQLREQAEKSQQSLASFTPNNDVNEQIDALFTQKAQLITEQTAEATKTLQELATQVNTASSNANDEKLAATLTALTDVKEQLNTLKTLQKNDAQDLGLLKDNFTATKLDSKNILSQTASLNAKIAALETQLQTTQYKTTRLIALQNLQSAFDMGEPYSAELQIFKAAFPESLQPSSFSQTNQTTVDNTRPLVGISNPDLVNNLNHYQQKGLPNPVVLANNFSQLIDQLAANNLTTTQNDSFWSKVKGQLASWVHFRPQGQIEGNSTGALLARMETAINNGNYQQALTEADNLPKELQQKVANYTDIMQLRLNGDVFFRQLAEKLFALGGAQSAATLDENMNMAAESSQAAPTSSATTSSQTDAQ